jgi:AAA+ superfamily predicted ATPase
VRFDALMDLDDVKRSLATAIAVVLNPEKLRAWAAKHAASATAQLLANRAPLFILGGDVGTGKTELAETIGDAVGRAERMEILLYRLSLTARGTGLVGEMTQRLSSAFSTVLADARKWKSNGVKKTGAILFIDEADAVAQSRAADQMHHEDRAGVNALIRSIDDLARAHVPVVVIMATNRLDALDPAIRRRAANVYDFRRPNDAQRASLFRNLLPDVDLSDAQLSELVELTGNGQRGYGFSHSDIVQRLVPDALLSAFADDRPLDGGALLRAARATQATPPFN